MKTIFSSRRNYYMTRISIFLIAVALIVGMVGCDATSQNLEIRTWYDLDDIRDNLGGNYTLMNNLDSTIAGYEELASPTANGGKGWQPIGNYTGGNFTGSFDGQGYEIKDLFINRPAEIAVGLFGVVNEGGIIKNISMMNETVISGESVGGLVGNNWGIVSDSHATGSVSGNSAIGGLVGSNSLGTVTDSYSISNVTGNSSVGGLVGSNSFGTVTDSYSTSSVSGESFAGGLVGIQGFWSTVSNSYSTGTVSGESFAGGLVGCQSYLSTVSNSYSTGMVSGDADVGGLLGSNSFGTVTNSYSTGSVTGYWRVGGLVGSNEEVSTVSNSYSTGGVTGNHSVGGLVGANYGGNVSDSYSTGSVTGNFSIGGLVGVNNGTVSYSFWDTETSGQNSSAGGTGKNTTEMQNIATFSGATWNITTVGGIGERNITYIWNIVDTVTYPFLSWQP